MKSFYIMIVFLLLLLTGCSAPQNSEMIIVNPQATENQSSMDFYQKFLEYEGEKVLSSMKLPSGGILVVQNLGDGTGKEDMRDAFTGETLHLVLGRIDAWKVNGKMKSESLLIPWADDTYEVGLDPIWMFYEENELDSVPLQEIYNNPTEYVDELNNYIDYHSHYFFLDGRFGRDVIIMVIPAMKLSLPPYSDCPQYGIEPYDSLESVPMKIYDQSSAKNYIDLWNCGYPIWIFAVPEQWIDDNYELHFGDYVLTGKEIISGTWSSDGVMPPPRQFGHCYTEAKSIE